MMGKRKLDRRIPQREDLIQPMFDALKKLGGSAKNEELLNCIIEDLQIPDEVADILHTGTTSVSELEYRAKWVRTYMKNYGVIENSARGVWSIKPAYMSVDKLDVASIAKAKTPANEKPALLPEENIAGLDESNTEAEDLDHTDDWRDQLTEVLQTMDPYGFERLTQRLLRECGFSQVKVTKKSGDGGIDGTGKLLINGIFGFNVAFQCKRYKGVVGAKEVRDFRGSLPQHIEKGVLMTTGTFSKAAKEEASDPAKKQIDLIDGEEFISKIAEYEIGVQPVITYTIDEEFFRKI